MRRKVLYFVLFLNRVDFTSSESRDLRRIRRKLGLCRFVEAVSSSVVRYICRLEKLRCIVNCLRVN